MYCWIIASLEKGEIVALHIRESCRPAFSAKLEGCILGRNTKVGARAELLRSLTQAGYEADAGGKIAWFVCSGLTVYTVATIRNEKLEVSDWTTGPGEESDEEQGE